VEISGVWTVVIAEDGDRVLGLYPSTGVLDLSIMVTLLLLVGRVCASAPGSCLLLQVQ
jgi:hypothetical protein